MRRGGGWLDPVELGRLLEAMGLPAVRTLVARTESEACAAADAIGFPVAVKAMGRDIVHKTDLGGVKLGVNSKDAVVGGVARPFQSAGHPTRGRARPGNGG